MGLLKSLAPGLGAIGFVDGIHAAEEHFGI